MVGKKLSILINKKIGKIDTDCPRQAGCYDMVQLTGGGLR